MSGETVREGYRIDVDGLRGIAVALVCLYHAGVWPIQGGYVGVDVFFVISGFVITRVLIRDLEQGRFSVGGFFLRRIRRLAPALALMLLVCILLFTVMYPPGYLKGFGDSVVAQSLFASNIYFWQTTDYFGAPSESKPLLHTWSLAVEEQFYVFFCLALLLVRRWPLPRLMVVVLGGLILSLALSIVATPRQPSASFYLLPTRAWELLSGSALALWVATSGRGAVLTPFTAGVVAWVGAIAIAIAGVFYRESTLFPYFYAVLPVAGTVLVIWANTGHETAVGRLLSTRPIVFLGTISYSVYLWHWVTLAIARWMSFGAPSLAVKVLAICAAVPLAWVSWRVLEQPIRSRALLKSNRSVVAAAFGFTAIAVAYGVMASRSGGFPGRAGPAFQAMEVPTRSARESECFDDASQGAPKHCLLGDASSSRTAFVAIGDSHALSMLPALDELAKRAQLRGSFAGTSGCLPFVGATPFRAPASAARCRQLVDGTLATVAEQGIRHVILLGRWDYYTQVGPDGDFQPVSSERHKLPSVAESRAVFAEQFAATVRAYQALGASVYVVLQAPHQRMDPESFVYRKRLPRVFGGVAANVSGTLSYDRHQLDQAYATQVFRSQPDVQLFDPAPLLCMDGGMCRMFIDGQSMYWDDDHLSVLGAQRVLPSLAPLFARMAANSGPAFDHLTRSGSAR